MLRLLRIYLKEKLVERSIVFSVPTRNVFNESILAGSFFKKKCFQCGYSTTVKNRTTKFKPNSLEFSDEEQAKILRVLNNDTDDSFKSLNIPPMQVNKLKVWKFKKGPFNSVNDVLDIEGIDVKSLIKICQSIILDKPVSTNRKSNVFKNRQLISPILTNDIIQSLTTAVGLHLGPAGISWAHISGPVKKLNYWGSMIFSDLPMKVSSWENFDLAIKVLNEIPPADLYIFEAPPGLGLQPQNQLSAVVSYTQHIEFTSMLLALLNTSKKHNKRIGAEQKPVENVVHYLKSKLAARLFKTWVGTESVSTITTVNQLFSYYEFELPCSPIEIDQTMMHTFERQASCNKELLGQSLLLAITFFDLCVYKNPTSLKAMTSAKWNK